MNPTERFTNRVADYVRYRPSYPSAVVDLLRNECGLIEGSEVADVGSGTGIFTYQLLEAGANVYAIEPNAPMREAAASQLSDWPGFHSLSSSAESTGLEENSVDFITCAQSAHWFEHERTKAEFRRILRPGGWLMLVWNERAADGSVFATGYEAILKEFCEDYEEAVHRSLHIPELEAVFHPSPMLRATFQNSQSLDEEGLIGRALSSSYAPANGAPRHEAFVKALSRLFQDTQVGGIVEFCYETEVFYGQL